MFVGREGSRRPPTDPDGLGWSVSTAPGGNARERDRCRGARPAPAVLNAANEEAVALFLQGQRRFVDIVPSVARALEAAEPAEELTLDSVVAADRRARAHVRAAAKGPTRLWSQLPA